MSDSEDAVAAVFREFCSFGMGSRNMGPPLMDSRQCQKLARDCGLLDKRLTKVDIDLIFTAVKGRGEHRIDYLDFLECVRQWAERKGLTYDEICDMIANSSGPTLNHVTTPDSQKFSSPLTEPVTTLALRPTPSTYRTPSASNTRGRTSPLSAPRTGASISSRGERRGSRPPPPPPASTALHPDWYEVQNPDPQGPDELVYYVNRKTNETSWNRPVVASPPDHSTHQGGEMTLEGGEFDEEEEKDREVAHFSRKGSSPYKSVFDKLTDHTLYTGTHKYRFNPSTGQGLGIKGRDSVGKGQGTVYTSPTAFRGNTNTGTDEVIHDISQIVNRK